LGEAVALEDGPLASMLRDWSPPDGLERDRLELARRIDSALEEALAEPVEPRANAPAPPGDEAGEGALARRLIEQVGRLGLLEEALGDLDEEARVEVGRDVVVGPDERIPSSLVVIGGDVTLEGTVDGDVVVLDGTLDLFPGGHVLGEVRLVEANLGRNDGVVEGDVVDVVEGGRDVEREIRDRIRSELRDEVRRELRDEIRSSTRARTEDRGGFHPFRTLARGVGGVLQNIVAVFLLGLFGMGVVAFAAENLDTVAETARRAPGRSAAVGLAGSFLLIPIWVLGTVALAVSIVGIPVMIAWLPLFPLAAAAAALLGYLAVARNVGEWLADSGYRYTDWIDRANPVTTIFGGLLGLSAFFIVGNLLSMIPFLGFLQGLLTFAGVMFTIVAIQVGFGAVLLTRAGRRREYAPPDFDEAWSRAMETDVDLDADAPAGSASSPEGDHA
ncbi:MAG TPA: hypothetical protein VK849_00010, partial [Longimicrobiales bacterium]|nr:hypothetical protein [Longimicrobiales bacterium]